MRSLPLQCGAIRIASVAGVQRRIRVSGLVKARFLWLFRNFYILDFPVLNQKQQQLIAQVWNSGSGIASKEVVASRTTATVDDTAGSAPDLSSLELIGTVEGYLPQLYPAPVSAKFHVGDRIIVSRHSRVRSILPMGLRVPAIWNAMAILLLGGAITLGPNALGSRVLSPVPRSASPVSVAASGDAKPALSTPPVLTKPSPVPVPPAAAEASVPAADASSQSVHLPDAMASNASALDLTEPRPGPALRTKAPATRSAIPGVTIRVSVDRDGRAHAFEVLQGDRTKVSAALHAVKHFSFQPCANSTDCGHLLKFIDFGDASLVQRID